MPRSDRLAGFVLAPVHASGSLGLPADSAIQAPVLSPVWQTAEFAVALVFLLAAILAIIFLWRIRRIRADARRLEALVDQRTTELRETNRRLEAEIEQRKRAEAELEQRAEQELRKSEARFQAVFENIGVGIAVLGLDGRAQAVNPVTEQIIQYTEAELRTLEPMEMIVEADRGIDAEQYFEMIEGKRNSYVVELRLLRKDGAVKWTRSNYSLVRDLNGLPDYIVALIEDIDDEKLAAEKLAAKEAEYLRTLEHRIVERTEELNRANQLIQQQTVQAAITSERTRLARDLHDAVTQTMFSASLIAEVLPAIWEKDPAEGARRLEEMRLLTRGALAEMRMLLVELRPTALIEMPLPDLLRQLCESVIGRDRLPIQYNLEGQRKLPAAVQVGLYRIAQEALNNVVKHANATQALVSLRMGEQVRLLVADNGSGFDPGAVSPDHFGLRIMRERAEAIGADFSIYNGDHEGTQVRVVWQESESA